VGLEDITAKKMKNNKGVLIMKNREELNELLKKVAYKMEHLTNETGLLEGCPISIIDIDKWEWAQGVGLYGLFKYYQDTGAEEILQFLINWFEKNIERGLPPRNINTMCPMLTLSYIYEETGEKKYLDLCSDWAEWLMKEHQRTEEMGFHHAVSNGHSEQQLWDDTLFMSVLFLAHMGVILERRDYIEESERQFLVHIKYLSDRKSGLLYHGWSFVGRHNYSEALWARGNSWYTSGVVDYMEMVPELDKGVKMFLAETLRVQVSALEKLQDESGMWHTLLNEADTYVETSATAGIAYGILKAVRIGYLDKKYSAAGKKAAQAVIDRINQEGTVLGVSYGTGLSNVLNYYRNIKICPMTYGQALTIMMLTEVMKADSL